MLYMKSMIQLRKYREPKTAILESSLRGEKTFFALFEDGILEVKRQSVTHKPAHLIRAQNKD